MKSKMFFLLGVSGSGKGTLRQGLIKDPRIKYIQSYTTRAMRPGEVAGETYFFVSPEEFSQSIHDGEFLEYARPHDLQFSGTKRQTIIDTIKEGKIGIKELDVVGLEIVKRTDVWPMCKSIWLDIPLEIMEERIRERGPMNEYDLQRRRANAVVERAYAKENCDYIIDATQSKEKVLADVMKILFSE